MVFGEVTIMHCIRIIDNNGLNHVKQRTPHLDPRISNFRTFFRGNKEAGDYRITDPVAWNKFSFSLSIDNFF